MTFSPADLLLMAVLVATTGLIVLVYRRLARLDELNREYESALNDTAQALSAARDALTTLNMDGREVLVLLAGRIDDAHALIGEIDERVAHSDGDARRAS